MLVCECDIVALDFECTGSVDGFPDMPWQIGLVTLSRGRVDLSRSFHSFLRVPAEQPFNPYTPGRWASLRETLAKSPALHELWETIAPFLTGSPLLAHQAPTERGILNHFFPFQAWGPWLDTLDIAKVAYPSMPNYKLENLLPNTGLGELMQNRCPGLAPHDAYYDAVACATLLEQILQGPGWHEATIDALLHL